jgi:ATP adenylyltransferase
MVIPRSQESYQSVSVNALGFVFSLFSMTESGAALIAKEDPLNILTKVGFSK